MPLRLRGALLALLMAAMATQVSGASASQEMGSARLVTAGGATGAALSVERAQLGGVAGLLRSPPVSGGWGLLVAGLIGVWAIGHRRMSVRGSRSLDPHGLRRR
jgi:hypothetical protein